MTDSQSFKYLFEICQSLLKGHFTKQKCISINNSNFFLSTFTQLINYSVTKLRPGKPKAHFLSAVGYISSQINLINMSGMIETFSSSLKRCKKCLCLMEIKCQNRLTGFPQSLSSNLALKLLTFMER